MFLFSRSEAEEDEAVEKISQKGNQLEGILHPSKLKGMVFLLAQYFAEVARFNLEFLPQICAQVSKGAGRIAWRYAHWGLSCLTRV